jgi:uncharacterized protein YoaH (UPF0181 family)
MLTKYDPERAPDSARWLAESEVQLIDIVERYHRRARIDLPRPHLHAIIHVVVENQIAMGDETPVAEAIQRLMGEGLSRHDAIHAVGSVLAGYLHETLRDKKEADNEAYYADIRALTREKWFAEHGLEEHGDE